MTQQGRKIMAGIGAAGVIAVSGASLANSQPTGSANAPSSAASAQGSTNQSGAHQGWRSHTAVTGSDETKAKAAVKAKDAAVTVEKVFKHGDGTYDVLGTKAGAKVHLSVSKDLKTVQLRAGHPGFGGPGGHGEHRRGAPVTGAALTGVKDAVQAKDSGVTVERAFKESDGSYRVFGKKAGARVMVEVSKDLKTVSVKAGMPGGGPHDHQGHRGHHGGPGASPQQGKQGSTPSSSGASGSSGASATSTAPSAAAGV